MFTPLLGPEVSKLGRKHILYLKGLKESKWHQGKARALPEEDEGNGNKEK